MATPHPLVAALREERLRSGLSIPAAATVAGYTPQTIRLWERGVVNPRLDALADYAATFGYQVALYLPREELITPRPPELSPETSALLQEVIHLIATACGVAHTRDTTDTTNGQDDA